MAGVTLGGDETLCLNHTHVNYRCYKTEMVLTVVLVHATVWGNPENISTDRNIIFGKRLVSGNCVITFYYKNEIKNILCVTILLLSNMNNLLITSFNVNNKVTKKKNRLTLNLCNTKTIKIN